MSAELASLNSVSLAVVRQLLDAASPFTTVLEGMEVHVSVERLASEKWPAGVLGLDVSRGETWPAPVQVAARWTGGGTSFRLQASVSRSGKYAGLVSLEALTRTGASLLWITIPTSLAKESDGIAQLRALIALVSRDLGSRAAVGAA